MNIRASLVFPISLLSAACGVAPGAEQSTEDLASAQQQEEWSTADNPALLSGNLQRNLNKLPKQGEASAIPWPGSYWRMSQDSINYAWDGAGSLSATAKYEKAFGGHGLEDQVSRYFGIDSQRSATSCTEDSQCDESLNETCGKRAGESEGRCIPLWFGICDGWVAASLLFPEPKHPVVKNGVTFKVQDIKALLSLVLLNATSRSVSLRCEARDDGDGSALDAHGRPTGQDCRDTNPGTLHIILTNYLGIQKKSLVEDRTYSNEVWNQPLRGYKVLETRTVSGQEANRLLGAKPTGPTGRIADRYLFNDDARSLVYVKNDVSYITEATPESDGNLARYIEIFTRHDVYEYILELDWTGDVIGGEWVAGSKRNHPDFLWLPTGSGAASVAGGAIRYDQIKKLADASVAP